MIASLSARKAAILLTAIDADAARAVMQHLTPEERQAVAVEIGRLESERPTAEETERILREFASLQSGGGARGGVSVARELLSDVVPEDEMRRVMASVESAVQRVPFGFVTRASPDAVVTFLRDEHPQAIGLILAHVPPEQGARILERLPQDVRIDVIRRMATMEQMSPEIVAEVERTLQSKMENLIGGEVRRIGGARAAAEILVRAGRDVEAGVMATIQEQDSGLAERIRGLMFTFDDLARCNDRGIQSLLKNVERTQLATALKLPAPDVAAKIFGNMSKRAGEMLQQDIDALGPVLVRDVQAARRTIEAIARQLEQQGELAVEGRGGEELIA
jgi:flagellar motor switch protein FliG